MQIQYNITRLEEWCKSHNMPEGTLQLEHLMQAAKLLQLKKVSDLPPCNALFIHRFFCFAQATPADIEIIYDVCWMLSPMQIQRMCTNYYVADYEVRPANQGLTSIHPHLRNCRIQFHLKFSASSLHGCKRTTGMTTYFSHRKQKKLAHTNCHSPAKSRDWRRMFLHILMFLTCGVLPPWFHSNDSSPFILLFNIPRIVGL